MSLIEPFRTMLDLRSGRLEPHTTILQRRLSHMAGMYVDRQAEQAILASEGDRLIYEVYQVETLPEETGQVLHCTTVIQPGQIGTEFHMTKGHFHAKRDRGEVYLGLAGTGYVILQSEAGAVRHVAMEPGAVVYVPPWWAHRTINSGAEALVFLSAWPGDAGHDYGTIERLGFAQLCLNRAGQAEFVPNPRYDRANLILESRLGQFYGFDGTNGSNGPP
jgi:glucose-6-phosphate isomerase